MTPKPEAAVPRPGSGGVAGRTREYRSPGGGHGSTVETPPAESEPREGGDIHWAKFPPPPPETFTRPSSTPPPPSSSHAATTSLTPTPRVPPWITNPHLPPQIAGGGSQPSPPQNSTNMAHAPNPKPYNKSEPLTHRAPRRGRDRPGRHRTCTLSPLPFCFHSTQKIPYYIYTLPTRPVFSYRCISATHFLGLSYSLYFRLPTCTIVNNSFYRLTWASGIHYF